jgi:DNA repair exonuclease SbcCD ATPase subunit
VSKPTYNIEKLSNVENDIKHAESQLVSIDDEITTIEDEMIEALVDILTAQTEVDIAQNLVDEISETIKSHPQPELATLNDVRTIEVEKTSIKKEIELLQKQENPYEKNIEELQSTRTDAPDWDNLNKDKDILKHMDFVIKLMTRKDSIVRKTMISRFLPRLNELISIYLEKLMFPYSVEFTEDLEAAINDFGKEIDPSCISGGQEERLSMAVNWAFRDVFEEINDVRIDFSAIDERLDSGLDMEGADSSIRILQDMIINKGRDIWVVTHRKELEEYADRVLRVEGDDRFSKIKILEKVA